MYRKMFGTVFVVTLYFATQFVVGQNINITGTVTDKDGNALPGAQIELESAGTSDVTKSDGSFSLVQGVSVRPNGISKTGPWSFATEGRMTFVSAASSPFALQIKNIRGATIFNENRTAVSGVFSIQIPAVAPGVYLFQLNINRNSYSIKGFFNGALWQAIRTKSDLKQSNSLLKVAAFSDVLMVSKAGYMDYKMDISSPEASDIVIQLQEASELDKFSFFVTSYQSLVELSENELGFGGDLRFGETGPGAGLKGADKICATIADMSMPGSSSKQWRAFLSVRSDENGNQVNAIDRIGEGPWYDRLGRLLSNNKAELLNTRPEGAEEAIKNDLPNEFGVPNHDPDGTGDVDNHHMVTGTDYEGNLYVDESDPDRSTTCEDWTSSTSTTAKPRHGFAWPRGGMGPGFPGGGQGGFDMSGSNWMTSYDAPGCLPGVDLNGFGPARPGDESIGGGGGYGGFYCFALNP